MMRDDSVYLKHICDASIRIDAYLQNVSESMFKENPLVQDGVIRQLEIIGAAVKRVSLDIRKLYPEIPWQDIAGMRDKLIHDYFGVDIETVWLTAKEDIPLLKGQIIGILKDMK